MVDSIYNIAHLSWSKIFRKPDLLLPFCRRQGGILGREACRGRGNEGASTPYLSNLPTAWKHKEGKQWFNNIFLGKFCWNIFQHISYFQFGTHAICYFSKQHVSERLYWHKMHFPTNEFIFYISEYKCVGNALVICHCV